MNVIIRNATSEDCYGISEIIRESMGYYNPPELIKSNLERILPGKNDKVLIAEADGHTAGFIHAENYDSLYSLPIKDLMSFAVKPKFQCNGIGTKLLHEIEKWALETGRCGIRVISNSERKDAHRFYISRGYMQERAEIHFQKNF